MDDWQVGEVVFTKRGPPVWDGRGVTFEHLKASRFDDIAKDASTAEAATDDEGWSIRSLYYGGDAVQTNSKKPLILTERASEARGAYIYEVKFQPGYTVNVDSLRSDDGIHYRGRARYLVFLDRIIAVHPDEDLKIVGRRKLKVLKYNPFHDELGRFATGDGGGNTIEADIAGQVEGGGGSGYAVHEHVPPVYPLPTGYTIMPQADESTGIVDYQVYQEGHGVIGQFNDNDAAQRFAVEHAASQPETSTPALSTSVTVKPIGVEHMAEGYKLVPDTVHGTYAVQKDGYNVVHGNTEAEALHNFYTAYPEKALPPGYSIDFDPFSQSISIKDADGKIVHQGPDDPNKLTYDVVAEYLSGTPSAGSWSPAATGTTKLTIGSEHLPTGYKVEEVTTGGYPFKVTNEDGINLGQGNTKQEAIDQFFHSDPAKALPPGYTLDYNPFKASMAVLDEHGTIVHEHALQHESFMAGNMAYDTTAAYLAGAPSTFAEVAPTPFVPGVEHLPSSVYLNEHAGGWSPVKIINANGGEVLGQGQTKEEALKDYFTYHAKELMPAGYQVGYDHVTDVPIIIDPTGKEVYSGKVGQGGYQAAIDYLTQNPQQQPAAVAGAGTGVAQTPVHPGIANLPDTYELQEKPSAGGNPFMVVHDGYSVGSGKTQEEALHNFYQQHPKLALPAGFTLTHNYDTSGSDIKDASGNIVYTSPTFVHGYDAVVGYMTQEANKEQEVTSTLGTLPETRFGTGAGSGYEPLSEAGLPPGFNVTHDDTEGGSQFSSTGEVRPPSVHQFTTSEKDTVHSYTGAGNSDLNHYLREGNPPDNPNTTSRLLNDLDRVFVDTSTASTVTLYRGISANAVRKLDEAIKSSDGHFVDKGFASTSSNETVARNWKNGDYVTIEVPAGSRAFDTEHPNVLTSHRGEHEWIIDRNSHYIITKKEKVKSSYSSGEHWHYTAKLVNTPVKQKDTRQMELPFVDRGPVNKQRPDEDHVDKFIWDEHGIVLDYTYQKYNMEHDALGRFASGDGGGNMTIEADIAEATGGGSLPEMSPDGPIVYHGTSQAAIDHIEKEGLQAERGKGANEFIIQNMDPEYTEDRPASVYFAGSPINARMYAKYAGKATGSEPVVIPIRLTKAQAAAMVWDEHGGGAGEMRLQGATIPPSQIGKPAVGMADIDKLTQNVMSNAKNSKWFSMHVFDPKDKHPPVSLLPKAVRPAGARRVMGKADEADILVFAVLLVDPEKTRPQKTGQGFPNPKVKPKGQGLIDKGQGFLDAEQTYSEVEKYNLWHDLKGLFTSGPEGEGGDGHGSTGSAAASDTTIGELISPSHGTEAQREAVSDYTDEGYYDVNNYLRHNEEARFPTSTNSVIKHLDTILAHSTLPEETTVWRGLSPRASERMQEALNSGHTSFVDKGFVSTTSNEHYAGVFASSMQHNHAIAEIVLPKGTHARNIADWSSSPDEAETLVARDSAFKVVRHDIDEKTGLSVYHLRLLPDYDPNQLDLNLGKAKGSTDKFIWSGEEMHFLVEKYNDAHDALGRFTTSDGQESGALLPAGQRGAAAALAPTSGLPFAEKEFLHWKEEGGKVVAFHGTRKEVLDKIMKEGIKVQQDRNFPRFFYQGDRKQSIFVSADKKTALGFADMFATNAVVLELRIPKEEWEKFKPDRGVQPNLGRYPGDADRPPEQAVAAYAPITIPPEWIKGVLDPSKEGYDQFKRADDYVTIYMVIAIDDKTEKYNEEHDERGRFASASGAGAINQVGGASLESWTDHPTDIAGWAKVEGQMPDLEEPPFHTEHGERTASGVVIREPDGRVWLVHPTNQFGGYNATFPKGGVEPGLSMQANAIKEAYEETGLKVRITGYARDVERTTSKTRYYFAERVGGNPSDHEQHTDHLSLVAPDKLHSVADHPIDAPLIEQIRSTRKYNEYHDAQGLFTHGPEGVGGAGGGGGTEQPGDHRFTAERALTKEEKLGVGMYTATTAYREINEAYRKGFSMKNTPQMQAHANNLSKAIASRTVAEPITVYRGIRNDKLINDLDARVATGNNVFTDRGFASTSFSQHAALEFTAWHQDSTKYMMRINIPKGAHALAASAEGLGARDEEEVVLQHGSRFRVTARHDEGNQVVYDADLLIDE